MEKHIQLPYLCVRAVVIYPGSSRTLMAGRDASLAAVAAAQKDYENKIVVITQRSAEQEFPQEGDLYQVGTVCEIAATISLRDGGMQVHVEGWYPLEITQFSMDGDLQIAQGQRRAWSGSRNIISDGDRSAALRILKDVRAEDIWLRKLEQAKDTHEFLEQARSLLPSPGSALSKLSPSPFRDLSKKDLEELNWFTGAHQTLLESQGFLEQVQHISSLAQRRAFDSD